MTRHITIPKYVSHETIDGETIVINLDKGHYFSLQDTASDLWNHLVDGKSPETVVNAFETRGNVVMEEVRQFFVELENEGLITPGENVEFLEENINVDPDNYSKPSFQKFTDMEDLLLLDPIHDTDESGWPHQAH